MTTTERAPTEPHPGWRWFAALGGMTAYAGHLLVSYFSLPILCLWGTRAPLYAVTAVAAAVAASATVVGWRHRGLPPDPVEDLRAERRRFLSRAGVFLSLLATLTIIAAGSAVPLFDPCENWV